MGKRLSLLFSGSFLLFVVLLPCLTLSALVPSRSPFDTIKRSRTGEATYYTLSAALGQDGHEEETFRFEVEKTDFSCSEGSCEHFYDICSLQLNYKITPLKMNASSLEAEINCNAVISYQTGEGDFLHAEVGPQTVHHVFDHRSTRQAHLSFTFYFSYYEAVEHAQLESLECHIHNVHQLAETEGADQLDTF